MSSLGVHFSSETNEWGTPQKFYDKLNDEFYFQGVIILMCSIGLVLS